MSGDPIELSKLPPPDLIKAMDIDEIYAEMSAMLVELYPAFDPTLESSLPARLLQIIAYLAAGKRQEVNDGARGVMLPFAKGSNLDNLGSLLGVLRLVITPADPAQGRPDPVMEADADFLARILLAPASFSVAGPEAAYRFHARSASGNVLDASATSPKPDDIRQLVLDTLASHGAAAALIAAMTAALDAARWPGDVVVSVLARDGDGSASDALLKAVQAAVSSEDVRPLTDNVIARSAEILRYRIHARLWTFAGPDSDVVLAASRKSLDAYLAASRRLGRDITLSGLYGALHVAGIQSVVLITPTETLVVADDQAAYCTDIQLDYEGIGA